jgi:ABC-type glycerol-3-phosphate transport system substrate-binding protein
MRDMNASHARRIVLAALCCALLSVSAGALAQQPPVYADWLARQEETFPGHTLSATTAGGAREARLLAPGDSVLYRVDAPQSGLYQMEMDCLPLPARRTTVEIAIRINGETPFVQAERVLIRRLFEAASSITQDSRGHDLRPDMQEAELAQTIRPGDHNNHYARPYYFYLKEGVNDISLTLLAEALFIGALRMAPAQTLPDYAQYRSEGPQPGAGAALVVIQAEEAGLRNAETFYPLAARGDASLQPADPVKTRLNTIGGYAWKQQGEWIEWPFEVPEDGWYSLRLYALNDFVRGMPATRRLYIDGRVPFKEAMALSIPYAVSWQDWQFNDESGAPYRIYLSRGSHRLRLEVAPGGNADSLRRLEEIIARMNAVYRDIIVITGDNADGSRVSIDLNRDFHLDRKIPGLMDELAAMRDSLFEEFDLLSAYAGAGSEAALLQQSAILLESFIDRPDLIPARLESYKGNLSGLSSWVLYMREQPLQLDRISLAGENAKQPDACAGLLEQMAFRWQGFIGSFTEDYNAVGNIYDGAGRRPLQVWVCANDLGATGISSGRDQTQIMKELIDQDFVGRFGIPVNLSLIDGSSTLMQATLGGKGPDVALTVYKELPVNLAMRGALVDLTRFEGLDSLLPAFHDSALVPYRYRGGLYALPETQNFDMVFYRKDIFDKMGLQPPETWAQLRALVPVLQKQGMQIGIAAPTVTNNNTSGFQTQLFQRGLNFYTKDLTRTTFDEPEALMAFRAWTELYTKYSLPVQYDFFSRFRTGEMPLAIAGYTTANTLAAAAPELSGLWQLAPIPGIPGEDGSVNRSQGATGTGAIILGTSRMQQEAFTFISWWTSREVQARFALALEGLMGSAARWPTANREAFLRIKWTAAQQQALLTQWDSLQDIPQLPGNYITNRNLTFAFRAVVYQNQNPREVLGRYNKEINKEIQRKWEEFSK